METFFISKPISAMNDRLSSIGRWRVWLRPADHQWPRDRNTVQLSLQHGSVSLCQ